MLYRRLLEQADPSSDYGARAQARIAQGEGAGATPPSAPSAAAPAAPPAARPPATPPPDIDTTDLPGAR